MLALSKEYPGKFSTLCYIFKIALTVSLHRSFNAGDFLDLEIKCGSELLKVHKLVVCSQSAVLRAMCLNGFKVVRLNISVPAD